MQLNNLDVIILIIILISALIALNRGLVKEVLSIVGWVLGLWVVAISISYIKPIAEKFVESSTMAGALSAVCVLVAFFIFWIFVSSSIVGKIRSSKLSGMDRFMGLSFGILRAFLLIALLYILISWIMPKDEQPELFKESKLFQISGKFAAPIEKLIPAETLKHINAKTKEISKADEPKVKDESINGNIDNLFEKLSQPQLEKKKTEAAPEPMLYDNKEQMSLDRLIENTLAIEPANL